MAWGSAPDDGPLLLSARRGDVAAFNELVLRHQRRLYNVCLRTLGSTEDAADATQEAFLSAFRSIKGFEGPPAGFQAWLVRIGVNQCYDALRRRKRRPAQSLDDGDEDEGLSESVDAALSDPAPGPESQALTAETARRVQDGLDRLSSEQRTAVVLCDVQGFSYEEAAVITGAELGTVKSRLSRGRAALREYLKARGELPSVVRRSVSETSEP